MGVDAGYKQTEVGIIPEDWGVKPLAHLSEKIMVGIASAATHAYRKHGVPMFRNQNIRPGYLNDTDILYISEEYERSFKNKRLKANDLLTARTGYPGTTCLVPSKYEGAQSFTTLITRPNQNLINSEYLSWYINSPFGQRFFEQNQIGGGQKNVNAGSLKVLPVLMPPLSEQSAIAQVLSDVEAQIVTIEKLIVKKRDIKQATMQQLLTGKTRLPGFNGKWETMSVSDLAKIGRGRVISHREIAKSISAAYPVYSSQTSNDGVMGYLDTYDFDGEYVTWTTDGANAGKVFYRNGKFNCTNVCGILKVTNDSARFLALALDLVTRQHVSTNLANPKLMNGVMRKISLKMPTSVSEQESIAEIEADFSLELSLENKKLEKLKLLKQGMMQELLTGRIRLI